MARGPFVNWNKVWPEIKALLDEGCSAPEAEKRTGIKATSINAYCSRIGYRITRRNADKIKYTAHDVNLMVVLRFLGLTHNEIADKFDCSYYQVSHLTAKKFKMAKMRVNGFPIDEIASDCDLTPDEVVKATSNIMQQLEDCGWIAEHVSTNTITNGLSAAGGIN